MIIEPDFLHHWKTLMLIEELQDKAAPLYVIALWAHCQQRKTDTFTNLSPGAIKAVCRYDGDAESLHCALHRCGFLKAFEETTIVHGWSEVNAKLVSNWSNGPKGGRPSQSKITQPKPNDNPTVTQPEPKANPTITDREDREEKIEKTLAAPVAADEPPPASKKQKSPAVDDVTWLAELAQDAAYRGIDVATEHARMTRWCLQNRKQPTRRRFVNWLNRADRPLFAAPAPATPRIVAAYDAPRSL